MDKKGILYIVATPIGNLGDISNRAIEILKGVAVIAAEDTRHSQKLCSALGISKNIVKKKWIAVHDFNEREKSEAISEYLAKGENVALISDAGTPLISDPGYHVVKTLQEQGFQVSPIPGSCALIAALSASGLPSDRFVFEGFLPAKTSLRIKRIEALVWETRTLIFYEAPHRLVECLEDMQTGFGKERKMVLARELTKTFETIRGGSISDILQWVESDPNQTRGEVVLLVKGRESGHHKQDGNNLSEVEDLNEAVNAEQALKILKILLSELSLSQASMMTAKITGMPKRKIYELGLGLQKRD